MKEVDLGEPTSFLDHVYLGCTQRACETSKDIVENYRDMIESRISAGAFEKQLCSGRLVANISSWSYDMQRNARKYIANWRTKQLNSYTKSQHHALMTERNCELKKQINSTIAQSHNSMP